MLDFAEASKRAGAFFRKGGYIAAHVVFSRDTSGRHHSESLAVARSVTVSSARTSVRFARRILKSFCP